MKFQNIDESQEELKAESGSQNPEEAILYGAGAGLFSYVNVLADQILLAGLDKKKFEVKQ